MTLKQNSSLNLSTGVCGKIIGKGSKMAGKLAIDGCPKVVTNEPVGWPRFDEEAIKAVEEVLGPGKVNYWTGPNGMVTTDDEELAWQLRSGKVY